MSEEIWEDIVGYEGSYQVSNLGRIKSLRRLRYNSSRWQEERIMKQTTSYDGYMRVILTLNGIKATMSIHRMAAIAFVSNLDNLPQVNHIDKIKSNNAASNLEWMMSRSNKNHSKNKRSASKYPGVGWSAGKSKWVARCYYNKKQNFLGYFDDEKLAASTYIDFCNKNNLKY